MELTLGVAFIAGLVSFLSPCVLPLVPAYIGYMGGRVTNTVAAGARTDGAAATRTPFSTRFNTALHGTFFVAGFMLVFVAIGLLSTAFIQQVGGSNITLVTDIIGRLGGVMIVFFGLHFMGVLPKVFVWLRQHDDRLANPVNGLVIAVVASALIAWGFTGTLRLWATPLWDSAPLVPGIAAGLIGLTWAGLALGGAFHRPGEFWNSALNRIEIALYSDTRAQMNAADNKGFLGSGLMGVVFAAGWTPCIGPVYGAVLTLAASGGDVGEAGTLLTAYSLGLGVPFLLTALMLDSAQGGLRRVQRHMETIKLASGAFLILIGVTIALGTLQNLSAEFAGDFAEFSTNLEDAVLDLFINTDEDTSAADAIDAGSAALETVDLASLTVGLDTGNLAPDFMTVTDTGETVALSDLRGQVVLLNFWATWCSPCRAEMPEFQAKFDERASDGFTILAVNNAESAADVADFRAEFDLTFPLLLDEAADIQEQYGIFSYPSTLMLDKNGVIVAKHYGPLTTSQLDELIALAVSS